MRYLIAALLACMVVGVGSAFAAGNAYDDVPTDHWAYNALNYLTQRGVLEGYPDGFFKGDRTLTRYEFAQAIARLLDSIETMDPSDAINVMAETLRAEFSDQLAEINRGLVAVQNEMMDLDGRVSDLEGGMMDNASKISSLEDKIACLKPGPNWKGAFRYRWQFEDWADNQRFRQRIQFMLGYNKYINDAVMIGFRLKTNTGNSPVSGDFTLGNYGRTADIWLDRAYVKYSPSWFGYYMDEECNPCIPRLDIYAGIIPNIHYDPHEMIFDSDVNLQGVGVVYHFNRDFQILTTASVAVEVSGHDYFDDDTYMFGTEIKHDNLLICGLDAWIGCYGWKNESLLPSEYFYGNMLYGFDFNNDLVVDGNDRFSPNFNTIKGGLQYTYYCLFNKPLAIYGEYMVNVDSTAEDRIALVNPFIDPDIIYETSDDTGFVVGAQLGEVPKYCGDWFMFARYKEIGANAVIHGFADACTGGANTNSFEAHWAYMWADNSMLGITYVLNKMNNAFGFLIPEWKADRTILLVDWTFRF